MNIVYIHTHDSGRYFDPYGKPIQTPAIQRLAERSTLFRQAFSSAPNCSPSRAALLTGMNPHSCGMNGLAHRGFALKDYGQHIVRRLNGEGYDTALCGIQHVADPVEKIGYRRILDNRNYDMSQPFDFDTVEYDVSNARSAAAYIAENGEGDRPFFLSFGMFNTHRIYPPVPPEIDPDYLVAPAHIKDTKANREDFAGYVASARVVDECVDIVMTALDAAGLREKTIVVFTTDHGIAFPDMKCSLYDTGIGVTLIVDYPGNPLRGAVSDALVSHLDLFPTICEIAGIAKPDWLEGESLLPLFEGKTTSVRDAVFAEVTYHAAYEPMRSVRTNRYKLIKRFDPPHPVVFANMDDCSPKDLLVASGYGDTPREPLMLFDLINDPVERKNLARLPEYRDLLAEMESKLDTWMVETHDPMLDGPVPMPPGAFANLRSSISPGEEEFEYGG